MTRLQRIAAAVWRAAHLQPGDGVVRLAKATMGVHVDCPQANADVMEAGLGYALALWWLSASGLDITTTLTKRLAGALAEELLCASAAYVTLTPAPSERGQRRSSSKKPAGRARSRGVHPNAGGRP